MLQPLTPEDAQMLVEVLRHKVHTHDDVVSVYGDSETRGVIVMEGLSYDSDYGFLLSRYEAGQWAALPDEELKQRFVELYAESVNMNGIGSEIYNHEISSGFKLADVSSYVGVREEEALFQAVVRNLMEDTPISDLLISDTLLNAASKSGQFSDEPAVRAALAELAEKITTHFGLQLRGIYASVPEQLESFREQLEMVGELAPSFSRTEYASAFVHDMLEEVEILLRTTGKKGTDGIILMGEEFGLEGDLGLYTPMLDHTKITAQKFRQFYDSAQIHQWRDTATHELTHRTDYVINNSHQEPLSGELLTTEKNVQIEKELEITFLEGDYTQVKENFGKEIHILADHEYGEHTLDTLYDYAQHQLGRLYEVRQEEEGKSLAVETLGYAAQFVHTIASELQELDPNLSRKEAMNFGKAALAVFSPTLVELVSDYQQVRDNYLQELRQQQGSLQQALSEYRIPDYMDTPDPTIVNHAGRAEIVTRPIDRRVATNLEQRL